MKGMKILLALLALWLLSAGAAYAAPLRGETIRKGETVDRDLEVLGDDLVVEAGAIVNGDVSILGGHAEIAGTINGDINLLGGDLLLTGPVVGDVVVIGGTLNAGSEARVGGDCVLLGGSYHKGDASELVCTNVGPNLARSLGGIVSSSPQAPPAPAIPEGPQPASSSPILRLMRDVFTLVGRTLLLGGLAWLVASAWPENLRQVARTASHRPFASGAVGILTAGAVASLGTILAIVSSLLLLVCVGLLGFPILFILLVAFASALTLGWISMGHLLGRKLDLSLRLTDNKQVNTAVVGTMLLTFALGVLGLLPSFLGTSFLAGLLGVALALVGLGAAALTQFGRQPFPALAPSGPGQSLADEVLIRLPDDPD